MEDIGGRTVTWILAVRQAYPPGELKLEGVNGVRVKLLTSGPTLRMWDTK